MTFIRHNGAMGDENSNTTRDEQLKLERLVLALKASNEGIWDWWTDQAQIFYSRRILEFLECSKSNAPNIFFPPHLHIHSEDRDQFSRAVQQALSQHGPETLAVDARVQTGSGEWRWLRIRGSIVRQRDGHAQRIAGSMIDISRRKLAEAQVEEERFLLRQLIDHVPMHIYFKDQASCFTMVNQGMAEWMGFPQADNLLGMHDRDFFDEAHWRLAEEDEQKIMLLGEPITGQLERETWHEGDTTWVLTSKFPWRDRHGKIRGTFGISNDVTKLVEAEKKATDLANQLAHINQSYEQELSLAREIQQALTLVKFPTNIGHHHGMELEFGARYVPISGLAGDFYEVMIIDENRVALFICDVMGHGVRSALIVAMLRGLLEKQQSVVSDPSTFLHGLNQGLTAILKRAGTTMFATALVCVIDVPARHLRYACAGHPGAIFHGPQGVRQLAVQAQQRGPVLGVFEDAHFPSETIPLDEIERLILFTDGVLEAENSKGECFFEGRLKEIITAGAEQSLVDLLDEILKRVLTFSESNHFDDDVCLLGIDLKTRSIT